MKSLLLAPLLAVSLLLAACGGEPPAPVEETEAALTSSQIWQKSPALFEGYSYACNGLTWSVRQFVTQTYSPTQHYYFTALTTDAPQYSSSRNDALNEVQVVCPSVVMQNLPTLLASGPGITCQVYAHPAHFGWDWSEQVTIAGGNLRYAPIGTYGHPAGYWDIQMTRATSYSQIGTGYGLGCFGGLGATAEIYAF